MPVRVLLFYVLTLGVLMSLFPWNEIGSNGSPFVQIFSGLGIPAAPHILNAVVITAALSAINSDIFGAGRILFGLARPGPRAGSFRQGLASWRALDDGGDDGGHPPGGRRPERRHPRGRLHPDRLDSHVRHRLGVGHDPGLPCGNEARDRPQGPAGVGIPVPVVAGRLRPDHRIHGAGDRRPGRLRGHPRCAVRGRGRGWACWSSPTGCGSRGTDDGGPTLWTKPHRCRWSPPPTPPGFPPAAKASTPARPGLSSGMVPFTNLLAFALASRGPHRYPRPQRAVCHRPFTGPRTGRAAS